MLAPEERKQLALKLTMEYLKQNNLLNGSIEHIPSICDSIEKIYKSFYKSLEQKEIL